MDFFTNKKDSSIALPEFKLNILWMEKNIAVAVDQVYSRVSHGNSILSLHSGLASSSSFRPRTGAATVVLYGPYCRSWL